MTVSVLLFASYAELIGQSRLDLDLKSGATVDDVISSLGKLPNGHKLPPRPLIAVNQVYASAGQPLAAGDEIAIIPPVAGG